MAGVDSPVHSAEWEWWMLVILGFVGTAVVVGLVMGTLCLVWHCCAGQASRGVGQGGEGEKDVNEAAVEAVRGPHSLSQNPSFVVGADLADVGVVEKLCESFAQHPLPAAVPCGDVDKMPCSAEGGGDGAAERGGESPTACVRRQRSIAAHVDGGFSHDESVRLHLMRHADTADPDFGTFVRSSRCRR